jgi:Caenorhabditis protein of unknown function, DUF268
VPYVLLMSVTDRALRQVATWRPVLKLGQQFASHLDPFTLSRMVPNTFQLDQLDAGTAALLNIEKGPRGFAASADLWFNPPVAIWYGEGQVAVHHVSERILEVPYVISSVLRDNAPGERVMDFGASESTVSLSLASLGYHVTALDSRGYPFEHPNLTVVKSLVENWSGPAEPFDRIIAISAIEHVGIGAYHEDETDCIDDRRLIELFSQWLAPGKMLTVTVPYGTWGVDDVQRTYDDAHLDVLFDGWKIIERRIFSRTSPTVWQDGPGGSPAVAVIEAQKP